MSSHNGPGWDLLDGVLRLVISRSQARSDLELTGALAQQLQVALDSRGLIERAKGALMERERLDEQEASTHLRRAARSSGRKLSEVAREVAAGQSLPRGRARPTNTQTEQPKSAAGDPQREARRPDA